MNCRWSGKGCASACATILYGLYYVLAGQWILTFFLGNSFFLSLIFTHWATTPKFCWLIFPNDRMRKRRADNSSQMNYFYYFYYLNWDAIIFIHRIELVENVRVFRPIFSIISLNLMLMLHDHSDAPHPIVHLCPTYFFLFVSTY